MKYTSNSETYPKSNHRSFPALPPPWSKQHQLLPDYFNNLICLHASTWPHLQQPTHNRLPEICLKNTWDTVTLLSKLSSLLCDDLEWREWKGGREAERKGICVYTYSWFMMFGTLKVTLQKHLYSNLKNPPHGSPTHAETGQSLEVWWLRL